MLSSLSTAEAVRFFFRAMGFEVHTVKYRTDEDFASMPNLFALRYYEEIPENIVLTDPVGNQFYVVVVNHAKDIVLAGWLHVGNFYHLHQGGWIRMIYLGSGRFFIQVFGNDGGEVFYPPLPKPLLSDKGRTEMDQSDRETCATSSSMPVEDKEYDLLYMHTLTSEDMWKNVLALPTEFCVRAMALKSCEIKLIDEYGTNWDCFLNIETGRSDFCALTGDWAKFRSRKLLKEGDTILLAAPKVKLDVLHYIKK